MKNINKILSLCRCFPFNPDFKWDGVGEVAGGVHWRNVFIDFCSSKRDKGYLKHYGTYHHCFELKCIAVCMHFFIHWRISRTETRFDRNVFKQLITLLTNFEPIAMHIAKWGPAKSVSLVKDMYRMYDTHIMPLQRFWRMFSFIQKLWNCFPQENIKML